MARKLGNRPAAPGGDLAPPSEWAPRVLDAALDAIVTIDSIGRVVQFNRAAQQMFGYTSDEAIGRPVADLIVPPDLHAAQWAALVRLVAGEDLQILDRKAQLRALRRGGEEFPVELSVTRASKSPLLLTAFIRDLSELRAAEQRSTNMERLLTRAEELADVGSWELDLRSGRAVWSDGLYRIQGFEPGSAEPGIEMFLDLVHGEDRKRVATILTTIVESPEQIPELGITEEYRVVLSDGSVREMRARGAIDHDERGRPARWFGMAQDVTEQRLTERELQAHYAVGQALQEWESFDQGIVGLLGSLGTALDYRLGSLWTWDEGRQLLVCRAFWSAPGVDAGDFELVTRGSSFGPGLGTPGRAWQTRQPVVSMDLGSDAGFRRGEAAARLKLSSGIAFPVIADGDPLGVVDFCAFDRIEPRAGLLRTLADIGLELGRFLQHRRAELGPPRLSSRELQVLRLAAEGNSGPEIAGQLTVSPATVKTHFEHIYEKLGVSDRAGAVAYALRIGLIH